MKKLLFILFCISNFTHGQTPQELFATANNLYKEGKIEQALATYNEIAATKNVSSELFFNIGNCYYKLNKVGATIYNYEKALQLDPLNKDAANNLVFAKRLTIDRIEELPKSFFQKLNINYLQKLSYNQWAKVSVLFAIATALLFLLFYFYNETSRKRFYFITSVFSLIFFLLSIVITYNQFNFAKKQIYAIIFSEKVTIKNAPTLSSEEIFTLHEGTKVKILDTVDDWKKIELVDGKIGWMLANDMKLLSDSSSEFL